MNRNVRTFVAVEISSEMRLRAGQLIDRLSSTAAKVRWVEPHNLHLTLKFLGEVSTANIQSLASMLQGEAAREWMRGEVERLSIWVSEQVTGRAGAARTLADGGRFAPNLLPVLGREGALRLFHEFFSPLARWNK